MLSGVEIGLDTETKDGGLEKERGPGWVQRDGYILGVSVAWAGRSLYVPIRHPETECRPIDQVMKWVDYLLANCRVVFFNAPYDLAWLRAFGSKVWPEKLDDAQIMAKLLDEEYDSYSLDSCAKREGIPGKDEDLLNSAAWSVGIQKKNGSVKHGLWQLPARYVGPYAEQDALATLQLGQKLRPKLLDEKLGDVYRTEIALIRILYEMRLRGIRIDINGAEQAREKILTRSKNILKSIPTPWRREATIDDLRSPDRLAEIFSAQSIEFPRTAKTNQPSFKKEWLENHPSELAQNVRQARKTEDLANKFLGTYILGHTHKGRIHGEIDQLGTVTQRFAYRNPPLQQIPSRDEEFASVIRGCFLSELDTVWAAPDYSQQEPRLSVHFAHASAKFAKKYGIEMAGTQDAVDYYAKMGEKADFHQMVSDMTGKPRRVAKDINLGLFYRMGVVKLAAVLGVDVETAELLMAEYHAKVPWVRGLAQLCETIAKSRGFVKMIDGARRHFPFWQPAGGKKKNLTTSFARFLDAQNMWPNVALERAFCFQAMNSVIQGSAARQTKLAMVACWQQGWLPMIQMHDELCYPVEKELVGEQIADTMRNVVKLHVPVRVDLEYGTNWGNAKHDWEWAVAA